MTNSKVPVGTAIPLSTMDGEEFYVVITQEERSKKKRNIMCLFRKGCGVAHFCVETSANNYDGTMTPDGIKALDVAGRFDENKEMLLEEN